MRLLPEEDLATTAGVRAYGCASWVVSLICLVVCLTGWTMVDTLVAVTVDLGGKDGGTAVRGGYSDSGCSGGVVGCSGN